MKLTSRQTEVLAALTRVTNDGCRYEPQFWLDGRNVSVQVRGLIDTHRLVELQDGRLSPIETNGKEPFTRVKHAKAAVNAMRAFLTVPSGDHLRSR